MAKFKLEIDMGNAAFDDMPMDEVARILMHLARGLEGESFLASPLALHDINGNRVGEARCTGRG
jgi:hypothetical protein